MGDIGTLLCGSCESAVGIAKSALSQLSLSIDTFSARAVKFLKEETSEDTVALGPFCARVLLENACAALVGRLDSFRLLYLSEFQQQPEYEVGKRARSSFSWFGDVIPEEKTPQTLWSIDHDLPKISRALFSPHTEHVYWKPAVERMLDFAASYRSEPALTEILDIDNNTYIKAMKWRSLQLYSTLSPKVFTGSSLQMFSFSMRQP